MQDQYYFYARTSTNKQIGGVKTQYANMLDFAVKRDLTIKDSSVPDNVNFYSDLGVSGAKNSREAYDQMKKDLMDPSKPKPKAIVVYSISRLSRSMKELITFADYLRENDIELFSVKENLDTTTPYGRMIFNVLSSFAEFEREIIVERVNDGLRRKMDEGFIPGPDPIFDKEEIAKNLREGMRVQDVVKKFGCSRTLVYRIKRKLEK